MANVTKHMNASPPMTPPTIAPVLLFELADASGTLVFGGASPVEEAVIKAGMELAAVEEIAEEEDDGKLIDGLGRVEGAVDDVEVSELGVVEASK
ncbi:MAG: hypothetical protein Q9225_003669 [Loekoesia sp. 1 TL-2023]